MNETTSKRTNGGRKLFSSQPKRSAQSPSSANKVVRGRPSIDRRSIQGNKRKQKPKMKLWKKILIVSGVSVLSLVLIATGLLAYMFSDMKTVDKFTADQVGVDSTISKKYKDAQVVNIALFGIDAREEGEKCRSDTIMIASIDRKHNEVKLTSILRDSLVSIDSHGKDKINHAYYYGGPQLAIATINKNYKMNIQDYATVNFNQMVYIIERLGGLEIEITENERKETNRILWSDQKYHVDEIPAAGKVILSGEQATTYARIRKGNTGDDNARAIRQQKVLNSLMQKILKMNKLEYPSLVKDLLGLMETTLTQADILSFSDMATKGIPPIVQNSIPSEKDNAVNAKHNGQFIFKYDLDKASDRLHKFIYEDDEEDTSSGTDSDVSSVSTQQ